MLRVLKIIGLMGLGSVLTLAGMFLSGAELVYINYSPPAEFGRDSDTATEPATFRRNFINYSGRYTPLAAPADPRVHLAARQALDAGAIPAQADTLALAGHRVVDGDGAIISFQNFWGLEEPGQFPPEAGFEKLTIFLAAPYPGEAGSVELGAVSGAFAFWSSGPANPPWDNACIAYTTKGRIDYRRNRDSYELDLDLTIQPVHAGTGQAEGCKRIRINQRASAWIGKMEYLDAWNGGGWGRVTIHEAVRESSF